MVRITTSQEIVKDMRQGSLCTNYAVTDMPTEKHATNCCVLRVQAVAKGHFFPPVLTQKAGLTQV